MGAIENFFGSNRSFFFDDLPHNSREVTIDEITTCHVSIS